ncbi:hypothetical protein ZIOFF_057977 [Zingiber officinale]|uniref:Uncharacterized protein n=1 Tax=Zingiber officinale TaxID=94328 RepID=A0A8J5F3A3_ZINOF|nr:hypothetical protein ZIOFF_057977 [Zingiber officinale]
MYNHSAKLRLLLLCPTGEVAAIPPAENRHPILASMGCGLTTTMGLTPPIVILTALMILPRSSIFVLTNKKKQLQIKDLLSSMKANWPTLACPSSDGSEFWSHEWEKHGTCSESILDQHSYFETSLQLKKQTNLLQILEDAGIHPDGELYSLNSIRSAISDGIGYTPGIECNVDESGNSQLFQVYLCVDTSATNLTDCPVYPRSKCSSSSIEFPSF